MLKTRAKYHIGQVVRHRRHPFRGVVFDVDAMFSNTEDWYQAIPEESRPAKDQPFYHLLSDLFGDFDGAAYQLQFQLN
jgi:heat shock protein HspQ